MDVKAGSWVEGFIYVTQWLDADSRTDHMDILLDDMPVPWTEVAEALLEADEGNVIEVIYFEREGSFSGRKEFLRIIDLQSGENYTMQQARIDELMQGGTSWREVYYG